MAAGARALAEWLAELEAREQRTTEAPAQNDATSVSVPKQGAPSSRSSVSQLSQTPAPRTSTRSLTSSIAHLVMPDGDLGEGTPGFPLDRPSEPTALEPRPRLTPDPTAQRFGDRDPTGVGKLAEGLPEEASFFHREATVPTEPFVRSSYERIELGALPAPLWFDDAITHHGMALPLEGDGADHTSFDELEVEPESVVEAPAARADRRRSRLDRRRRARRAAAHGGRRGRARRHGERRAAAGRREASASSRISAAAWCSRRTTTCLLVAFGLEVAGEDDVADRDGLGARRRGDGARCRAPSMASGTGHRAADRRAHRASSTAAGPMARLRIPPEASRRRARSRRRPRPTGRCSSAAPAG